LNLTWVVAFVS